MNVVHTAVSALSENPEPTAVQPQNGATGDFSLDNVVAEKGARHPAQPAKEARQKDDVLVQDLSALMAALLTPPVATNTSPVPSAGNAMLNTTALAGVDAHSLVKLLGLMSAQTETGGTEDIAQRLPHMLQSLFSENPGQTQAGTPAQQATLAKLAGQDLHSIGHAQRNGASKTTLHENLRTALKTTAASHSEDAHRVQSDTPVTTLAAMSNLSVRPTRESDSPLPVLATPLTSSNMDELGEKLNNLLKDRIQFQLDNQQQVSTIRLDPPSMGKLEIVVHLDGNQNLHVHIGASQTDVMKTLQQFSDHLRQHLVQQNFMQVNVQVSPDGQSEQQQQQQRQDEEAAILASNVTPDAPELTRNETVLLKV